MNAKEQKPEKNHDVIVIVVLFFVCFFHDESPSHKWSELVVLVEESEWS